MSDHLKASLDRIAAYESTIRPSPVTRVLRRIGTTAWFAAAYRGIGPVLDPKVARIRDGAVLAKLYGFPTLIMVSTGAKSGQPRTSPLLYLRTGLDIVVVGTNFGQPSHPGWTANLLAHPKAVVTIGGVTIEVSASLLGEEEWREQFPRFVTLYPGYANYIERRQGLTPRMFRLTPTQAA